MMGVVKSVCEVLKVKMGRVREELGILENGRS